MQENTLQADKHLHNPLEFHLRTFATSLREDGYRDRTVKAKLGLLADFGRWLGRSGRAVSQIDECLVEAFIKHKRRVRRSGFGTLQQFLGHLRKRDVIPDRKVVPDQSPLAELLGSYEKHLRSERGLVTVTILAYLFFVRKFLVERFQDGPFVFGELKPSDVSDFVLQCCRSMGVASAKSMTAAFRSFFRYLFQKGELQADLAASVPSIADRRLSTVPRFLTPEEVDRLLKACNRITANDRRDYAILLLLARLGLRAGEVVALRLEDINWRAGEILVRGKGLLHPQAGAVGREWARL